jgi:dTDP-4-amino-4,6-dideoxygalactose transaminase
MSTKLALHGGAPVRTESWPRWPQWNDRERENLLGVLERGEWGGFDPAVAEFEAAFARHHGAKHCITTVNGTTSIEAALRALGVGPGDEVIVPPYTFIATAAAVRVVGATPVFADIEPDTYNLSATAVEAAISPRTKAIIPVHFAGLPVDLDALLPLAQKHGLAVIEDAAHAHGSRWKGQPVGALGNVGSFSFQSSKNLSSGEGGALLTNDDDLADRMWSFVNCGRSKESAWYGHPNLGSNLRLAGWQCSILLAGLERLDAQTERRMENARRLNAFLSEVDGLEPMRWDERADRHAFHLYMFRYNPEGWGGLPRDQFVKALQAEGIPASTGYGVPLYQHPPLAPGRSRVTPCPVAEQACQEAIWLTQNLLLAEPEEMEDIMAAILKVRENVESLLEKNHDPNRPLPPN